VGKNHETMIQTAEVKFLHRAVGFKRIDHENNTEIRYKLNASSLNTNIKIGCSIYKECETLKCLNRLEIR